MRSASKATPVLVFVAILVLLIIGGRVGSLYILDEYSDNYTVHAVFDMLSNVILALVSFVFIKRYELSHLGGLTKNKKILSFGLLFFPLYIAVLNIVFAGEFTVTHWVYNSFILVLLCLSIGLSEELAFRGFLQSYIIKFYCASKKQVIWSVIAAAFIFGLLHLIKFDKGIYGELSQVAFATFIGVMFGALLLRTKRLWPLIVLHAIIDFAAKMDDMGSPFKRTISEPTEPFSALMIALVVAPCFIFGWAILRKKSYEELMA